MPEAGSEQSSGDDHIFNADETEAADVIPKAQVSYLVSSFAAVTVNSESVKWSINIQPLPAPVDQTGVVWTKSFIMNQVATAFSYSVWVVKTYYGTQKSCRIRNHC